VATEVLHPAPPPGTGEDERQAMTEAEQELWADVQPEFAAIHELRSDLPVECITICTPSFAGNHWAMALPGLRDWAPDVAADLAFHRAVLQAVQHGRPPRRWLLKTPGYLLMLDDLLAAYPDACVVLTHRDPARTMPSTVSTTAMIQWLRTDDVDLDGLSALIGAIFTEALATVTRRRRDGSLPGVHGDVRFSDLMLDPVPAVAAAYTAIGRELTPGHRRAMLDYLAAKPRGLHGVHRYTARDWGFDERGLRADLADYMDWFGVAAEHGG
jgi:Sulfotransferase family